MKNFKISIRLTLAFCVLLFIGYVLVLWGISAMVTPNNGRVEVATRNGKIVGAPQVAQKFSAPKYFWSRPSSVDYNGSGSGGSNKGPTNPCYLEEVSSRIDHFLTAHPYLTRAEIPAEMVTASGSGLDPHLSISSAMVQVQRVAKARGVEPREIKKIVVNQIEKPLFGPTIINVLNLNLALDEKFKN